MPGRVLLTYHPAYTGRGFSPLPRAWERYGTARQFFTACGFDPLLSEFRQEAASLDALLTVHDPDHLDRLQAADHRGRGTLDGTSTPAWRGVWQRARVAVGGSLACVDAIATGGAAHAFNPGGGLHHAHHDRTSGFCPLNDVVIAVRHAQQHYGWRRIAIIDIDGHHGDGTQELLYGEDVLTVSLHRYDGRFFPGSGHYDELGWGTGLGSKVNVPLPRGTSDATYRHVFDALVPPLVQAYRPQAIILQFGVDGHHQDAMVRLGLTLRTFAHIARSVHRLAHRLCDGRLVVVGGGGYNPIVVARCWATLLLTLLEAPAVVRAKATALIGPDDPPGAHGLAAGGADRLIAAVQTRAFPFYNLRAPPLTTLVEAPKPIPPTAPGAS